MSYTPGPWRVVDWGEPNDLDIVTDSGGAVAEVLSQPAIEAVPGRLEAKANAYLIAAAPKMYEACKNVLNWARYLHGPSGEKYWVCRLCHGCSVGRDDPEGIEHAEGCPTPQISAAIAKAEEVET